MKFSLRSLMIVVAIAAIPFAWWNNRQVCLERAGFLFEQAIKEKMASGNPCDSGLTVNKSKWLESLSAHHMSNVKSYRSAAYRPWERLWIRELPPEPPPLVPDKSRLLYP
jgi:hypothetical protein